MASSSSRPRAVCLSRSVPVFAGKKPECQSRQQGLVFQVVPLPRLLPRSLRQPRERKSSSKDILKRHGPEHQALKAAHTCLLAWILSQVVHSIVYLGTRMPHAPAVNVFKYIYIYFLKGGGRPISLRGISGKPQNPCPEKLRTHKRRPRISESLHAIGGFSLSSFFHHLLRSERRSSPLFHTFHEALSHGSFPRPLCRLPCSLCNPACILSGSRPRAFEPVPGPVPATAHPQGPARCGRSVCVPPNPQDGILVPNVMAVGGGAPGGD